MITVIGERVNNRNLAAKQVKRWADRWSWPFALRTPALVFGASRTRLDRLMGGAEYRIVNILPPDNECGTWDQGLAIRIASEAMPDLQGETIITLGQRVTALFTPRRKRGASFGQVCRHDGVTILPIPHPSGRYRCWTKKGYEDKIRREIARLVAETR